MKYSRYLASLIKFSKSPKLIYSQDKWLKAISHMKEIEEQNAALVKELEAVKADNEELKVESLVVDEKMNLLLKSIPKIKGDAVLGFVSSVNGAVENDLITDREVEEMDLNDFILLAEKHANSLINNKEG